MRKAVKIKSQLLLLIKNRKTIRTVLDMTFHSNTSTQAALRLQTSYSLYQIEKSFPTCTHNNQWEASPFQVTTYNNLTELSPNSNYLKVLLRELQEQVEASIWISRSIMNVDKPKLLSCNWMFLVPIRVKTSLGNSFSQQGTFQYHKICKIPIKFPHQHIRINFNLNKDCKSPIRGKKMEEIEFLTMINKKDK